MFINVGQCWRFWSMFISVDQCVDQILTNVDHWRSILISVVHCWCWWMLIQVDQCESIVNDAGQCWSVLISADQYWWMEQKNHWKIIGCSLISKGLDVFEGWNVMSIGKIHGKAVQKQRLWGLAGTFAVACSAKLARKLFGASNPFSTRLQCKPVPNGRREGGGELGESCGAETFPSVCTGWQC